MRKNKVGRAPKQAWIALILIWLAYAFNTGCRELMNKLMPAIVDHFNLSASISGLLGTAGTVGCGVLVLFVSAWGDKQGLGYKRAGAQTKVAIVYLALTFLTGLPVVNSLALIFLFQFVRFGFASGGESLDASACAEWFPEESRGFILSAHHTGYPWGSAIVCLLASWIYAKTGNWKTPFMVIPVIAVFFWIIYLAYAKKSNFEKNNEKIIEMELTPSVTIAEINKFDGEVSTGKIIKKKEPFYKLFKNKNVLSAFISYAFIVGAYFAFNYWLTPYLSYQCNMEYSTAASFSVVFTITAGLGQLFWGSISDRVGCKRTVIICAVWLLVCFLMLPLMKKSIALVVIIQLLMGFCMNASFPVLYTLAGASVRKEQLATAIGICNFSMIIGGFFPYIMGSLINVGGGFHSSTGYTYCLVWMIGSMIIALIALTLMAHEVSGPKRGKDWALTSYESCGIKKE